MKIRENCYMLGLGSTGGKIYKEFVQRHYKGAAANGSEQDHKALGDVPNKYILQGFDGFGGHRERAMDCLAGNEDFIKFVEGIKEDIVFILFAGGGSTGSGCAPIVAEMLLEEKDEEGNPVKTVCPVIALPASGESLAKHKNAYETVQELQEIEGLGATFFLNNDSNENYDYINKNFASMLDEFLSNESSSSLILRPTFLALPPISPRWRMLVSITIYKEKIYMKENDNNSLAETLVNYEMLIEMIPELGEVVYTGMVTLDAAKAVFQELSEVNQIDFVESLDCVKRMLQQRDSRIKEMENDIAAKTVVETPADYIPLQKANRDMERQNEFLEARIRKLDKENGQLKRQLAELQRKQDPEQERLKKIHEAVQLFSVKTEIYLKDMDKYAWLLDDLQNIPEEDLEEYVRAIKAVKSWAVSLDQKVDGLMDKVG